MGINLAMLIDKCTFKVKEGSDDVYYTLELSEYRTLTVPTIAVPLQVRDNGLKQRPDEAVPAKTHTVGGGDTLWGSQRSIMEMAARILRFMQQTAL